MTKTSLKLRGSMPALVTPFRDGKIDEAAFRALIDWQIAQGSAGLVPVGTTGESPTLSHEEHHRVVEIWPSGPVRHVEEDTCPPRPGDAVSGRRGSA